MQKIIHFDTFSGFGGFTLALERVYANNRELLSSQTAEDIQGLLSEPLGGQARTIGFSEIDKYASAVLKYHWPNIKNYGDITKINWSEVPDFDLLTGGSPCQDLSIAGKRNGLAGSRSGLFYEYIRALESKKPKYFIWENVKGALSSNKGFDFTAVLNAFSEAGYSLWWQVLNAKDFGVPQNRERIFVVGFRDQPAPEVFFEREDDGRNNKTYENKSGERKGFRSGDISACVNTRFGSTARGQQLINNEELKIRRLTPTECERLMGLPDDHLKYGINEKGEQFEISDSQKYKMAGNGVVVNVVEEIIKNIILLSAE